MFPILLKVLDSMIYTSFLLQVKKTHFIKILAKASVLAVMVLDGPGQRSTPLLGNQNLYTCSTFQCFVQLLQSTRAINTEQQAVQYSQFVAEFGTLKIGTTKSEMLFLPSIHCGDKICIWQVETDQTYHINITISSLNYSGKFSETCLFGGLVIAEQLSDEYIEHATMCENQTESVKQARNSYSFKSSLTVILYWYNLYSVISASVTLTSTQCSSVYLCDCTYFALCDNTEDNNKAKCQDYLNKVTRMSPNVSLTVWNKPKPLSRTRVEKNLFIHCKTMNVLPYK